MLLSRLHATQTRNARNGLAGCASRDDRVPVSILINSRMTLLQSLPYVILPRLVVLPSSSSSFSSFFFLFVPDLFDVAVGVASLDSFALGKDEAGVGACEGVV